MSTVLQGIDVSKHNGGINWVAVQKAGIDFAMIRAGYGKDTIDPRFNFNAKECNRLGIPIGVYWFSYATSVQEAIDEAKKCIETIKNFKVKYPVVYDFEYDSVKYAKSQGVTLSKQRINDMMDAFLTTVKEAGYIPMLYGNPDYLKTVIDPYLVTKYDLWLAHYSSKPYCDSAIWQYSEHGTMDGIPGNVDLNYCYKEYVKTTVLNKISDEARNILNTIGVDNPKTWIQYIENIPVTDYSAWLDELLVKVYKNRKRDNADWLTIVNRNSSAYEAWVIAISQSVKSAKGMAAYIPELIEKVNNAE